MIDATCELSFENDLSMSADDNSTLCYVAGAISRSLLKKLPKCQKGCCSELITRGNTMSVEIDDTESSLQDEEFLTLVSRRFAASIRLFVHYLCSRVSILQKDQKKRKS